MDELKELYPRLSKSSFVSLLCTRRLGLSEAAKAG